MLGYNATAPYVTFDANNLPVAGASPSGANQPRTVVLTSKAYGHLGGNSLTAQLVDPGAPNAPLTTSLDRERDPRQPGDRRGGRDHQHRGAGRRGAQRQPADRRRRDRVAVAHVDRQPAGRGRPGLAAERPAARAGVVPARAADPEHAADRQDARRLEGRRLPLLPGARQRDRDLGRLPRDRGAARAQLRDRPGDDRARRRARHLHRPADQRRRCDALAVRLEPPHEPVQPLRGHHHVPEQGDGPGGPQRLGRRPEPQLLPGVGLRRLLRRDGHGLHERQLRRHLRVLRARDPQRVVGADHVPEHQVHQQHPLVRRLLHVAARRLQARPAASRCRIRRTGR